MHPVSVTSFSPWEPGISSLIVYAAIVAGLIVLLLFLSSWLGERKPNIEKTRPYESGIIPTGSAGLKYPVPFYRVAIFFLLFDVEAAFIFAWAPVCRKLGWSGWFSMSFFILVLLLGLVYIWIKGGLEWGPGQNEKSIES